MNSFVRFRVSIEGTHHWPGAPERVSFLASPHRHLFVIEGKRRVHHDDRDVEFISLARDVRHWVCATFPFVDSCVDFGTLSCEAIARAVATRFLLDECVVWEDGENGGEFAS